MLERSDDEIGTTWRSHIGIPVRSLWLLLAYASDLARFLDAVPAGDDSEAHLPDILARLLVAVVERRLRRSLSRAYQPQSKILPRVRGRIDWLATETGLLLQRGQVACRYEELTHDTPRNRLVRVALEAMKVAVVDRHLAAQCRYLAHDLQKAGVSDKRPSRAKMSRDQIVRHDQDDFAMVKIAELALDVVLPSESEGLGRATRLDRDEHLLRKIFEKAIAGFYRYELHGQDGWSVRSQSTLHWPKEFATRGASALLPSMAADLILQQDQSRRLVIDTKFTNALAPRPYGGESFKSDHIYQLYAYVRSQAGRGDDLADRTEGVLLYPSIDRAVDETVVMHGHHLRFVTVDLTQSGDQLRSSLLDIVRVSLDASLLLQANA